MSNIPAYRKEVEGLTVMMRALARHAETLDHPDIKETSLYFADRLEELMPMLDRKYVKRRGPNKSKTVTLSMARDIIAMVDSNPSLHAQEIADHFGINPGRVSEVLSNRPYYHKKCGKLLEMYK